MRAASNELAEGGLRSMLLALAMIMAAQPEGVKPNCEGNTIEIDACFAERLKKAEATLRKYETAAGVRNFDNNAVRLGLDDSRAAFEAYRKIECGTVYEAWKDGTIRVQMSLACQIDLTDERTHHIWEHWLQYMDSTPPVLPEPQATR
jgi:uncharacterized protein YecT (DUF1311 family)